MHSEELKCFDRLSEALCLSPPQLEVPVRSLFPMTFTLPYLVQRSDFVPCPLAVPAGIISNLRAPTSNHNYALVLGVPGLHVSLGGRNKKNLLM